MNNQPSDIPASDDLTPAAYVSHALLGTMRVRPGETLLDACLRLGLDVPFSCRGGSCHSCLMRCAAGPIPERAQRGLTAAQIAQGYFLPCVCIPQGDMRVAPSRASDFSYECRIEDVRAQTPDTGAPGIVWVLEPMTALAKTALGDQFDISFLEPDAQDSTSAWPMTGQATALPETNYYLELFSPGLTPDTPLANGLNTDTPALSIGQTLWVRPSDTSADTATEPSAMASTTPTIARDPALWAELDNGRKVRQILDAFYAKVYADALLSPYFRNVSAEHVAGKQYAFLYEAMTGEDVYFGDNPRNAHHWMVISDALFDHRQRLMLQTLEAHGLSDDQIRRWTAFEEPFRTNIVKSQPVERMVNGQPEMRADGFEREVLTVGSICDHCGSEIPAGTTVLYHQRLGTISCPKCS